jgi:DNA-binding CsgD family transcriptional regulator
MTAPTPPLEASESTALYQGGAQVPLDASFKSIFDDLSEGVLVLGPSGHRLYSNQALNELVAGNACLPAGTLEPPWYIPADQRRRYMVALQGTSSLLTLDGAGTTSTWLELAVPGRSRIRAKVTISAFSGQRGRFAAWLFRPESGYTRAHSAGTASSRPAYSLDDNLAKGAMPAVGSLTLRERDVLALLLEGLRVSSIARRLYLSPQTVRNHLKSIFRKLGAHSQAELLEGLRPAFGEAPPAHAASRGGALPTRGPEQLSTQEERSDQDAVRATS